ncbi:cation-dependent mannose-6-phosphate receptor [Pocillopora verrucosa]|uniref:cation-dependent mannose-6-phosphate receptor n=1 Tax=Pocillopora verrucosa TaxID=203993 RepID=UPI00334048C1
MSKMAQLGSKGLLLLFIILRVAISSSEESCDKVDVCTCKFKNGSTVSLKDADGGSKPSFTNIGGSSGRFFDWNPCTPFDDPNDSLGCKQVMVCQIATSTGTPAGSKDTSFSVDASGNVVISYGVIEGGQPTHGRMSKITLVCDRSAAGNGKISEFTESGASTGTSTYSGTLKSKYACAEGGSSGGLSVGSILLIIFFPLVLMYIIIGVLINRYGRGVESMPELLPNHSFWADFPFLVKDGIVFTGGAIKTGCSSLSSKFKKDGYAEI